MVRAVPFPGYRFLKLCANLCAVAVLFGSGSRAWAAQPPKSVDLCERVRLVGELKPGLTDTEKKLVCGDSAGNPAWKTLPFGQIEFNLKNFLQNRGYFHPTFKQDQDPSTAAFLPGSKQEGGHYTVEVGLPTRVSSLGEQGGPESLKLYRKRQIVGEILTPSLLGTIEQWVNQRLGAIGYPCPKVTTQADPDTGAVVVIIDTGPLENLMAVTEEPIPGVEHGIVRRYDAFRLGERFNADLLTVTMNRITSLNIVQATYFTSTCEAQGAVAHQQIVAGPPRLLTFGVGIDTEGVVQLRGTWRNARIGNRASFAQATAQFSAIDQEVSALFNWYHLPFSSRRYIQPSYLLQHVNDNAYEIITTKLGLQMGTSYDDGPLGAQLQIGPVLELVRTLQGSGVQSPNDEFLELEASARLQSHKFEYWATDPRTGYTAAFVTDFAGKNLASTASAQRFHLTGEMLFNYRDYDPPLWIFGLRGGFATTVSSERPGYGSQLPANFFWYLGGSTDLRGFSLQSVPGLGAMTVFYLDPELRLTALPLFGVQPFLFCDIGMTGLSPMEFDSPLLYSPGLGLRYKSPFGVFRTTLARGFPINPMSALAPPGGWTFYFSFGEEF
jgi:translocation and assembly module TamA